MRNWRRVAILGDRLRRKSGRKLEKVRSDIDGGDEIEAMLFGDLVGSTGGCGQDWSGRDGWFRG